MPTNTEMEVERREKRRREFKDYLDKALRDPDNRFDFERHPFPWTAAMVIWNGPGVQFLDANNRPVLQDLLRDQDDAVRLLDLCNALASAAKDQRERCARPAPPKANPGSM